MSSLRISRLVAGHIFWRRLDVVLCDLACSVLFPSQSCCVPGPIVWVRCDDEWDVRSEADVLDGVVHRVTVWKLDSKPETSSAPTLWEGKDPSHKPFH